jgi:hypothetical protein
MLARALLVSICLAAVVGCGENSIGDSPVVGEPISGDVAGTYGTETFTPMYGVAVPSSAPEQAELEIQLSPAAINCERHLQTGLANPRGLFARIFVKSAAVGSYPSSFVEFDELTNSHTSQKGSTSGSVEILAIDVSHVKGSIAFQDAVNDFELALNGGFDVKRCP